VEGQVLCLDVYVYIDRVSDKKNLSTLKWDAAQCSALQK
jgi:hypothetical protein